MDSGIVKANINRILESAIGNKLFPGAVFGMTDRNGNRIVVCVGGYKYDKSSPQVKEDSIYDVASITKSIPTASLALQLIDEGKLSADDKLIKYIPEFNNSDKEKVLIKHLLTFTLDFNFRMAGQKEKTPEEILKVVYSTDFNSPPGQKFFYHNASSILLGLVVERITGDSLDKLADERLFKPLKMDRTTFYPLKHFNKGEIVPSEIDDWRSREIRGEVHDESAYALQSKMVPGNAGLFSTVPDLLSYMEMLLNNGKTSGIRYFSENIIDKIETNQIAEIGASMGWGWEVNNPITMGRYCGEHTFAKTGFTGCLVGADRQKNIAWVLLSNCKYPKRTNNIDYLNQIRSEVADIVLGD